MQSIIDRLENEEARFNLTEVEAAKHSSQKQKDRKMEIKCYFCKEIGDINYKSHDTKDYRIRRSNKKEKSIVEYTSSKSDFETQYVS